jgi:hypothetical protein
MPGMWMLRQGLHDLSAPDTRPQRRLCLALPVLWLAACHTGPPRAPPAPPALSKTPSAQAHATTGERSDGAPKPGAPRASAPAVASSADAGRATPLAAEQRWLARLYQGTPVRVAGERGGAVRVELPLRDAFEARSDQPTPGLNSVLQHLAQSLARQPRTRLGLAASGDDAGERQQRMRAQLMARGVPAHRMLLLPTTPEAGTVSLRLALAPSAIGRLRDRDLRTPSREVLGPVLR